MRDLWVEAVPHEPMVYVKHVRKWGYVDEAAKKVTADFQEFIKAHLVQAPTEQPSGS